MARAKWQCSGCGATTGQDGWGVFCTTCNATRPTYLPDRRYLAALERFRAAVAAGKRLWGFDDDTPGNKDMQVSWGLCHTDAAMWPDAEDHVWPFDFKTKGRSEPLSLSGLQPCPFDKGRDNPGADLNGCFYRCEFFKRKRGVPRPTREEIVARYDVLIARASARIKETP